MAIFNKTLSNFSGGAVSERMQMQIESDDLQNNAPVIENFKITSQGILIKRNGITDLRQLDYDAEFYENIKILEYKKFLFIVSFAGDILRVSLYNVEPDEFETRDIDYPGIGDLDIDNFDFAIGNIGDDFEKTYVVVATGLSQTIVNFEKNETEWIFLIPGDIETARYSGKSFDTSFQSIEPISMTFNSDLSVMYILDTVSDTVYQYELSTPGDIDTASYLGKSFYVGAQSTESISIIFNSDLSVMYILDTFDPKVYQYDLSGYICSDPQFDTETSCLYSGPSWINGSCSDPQFNNETACEANTLPIIIPDSKPTLCEFFGGRLWLSGFTDQENRIIASEVGDILDFTIPGTITDESPLDFTLPDIHVIKFILGGKKLQIGHDKGISIISSSGVITTADSFLVHQSTVSVAKIKPVNFKNGFVYVAYDKINLYYSEFIRDVSSWRTTLLTKNFNNTLEIKEIHRYHDKGERICCLMADGSQIHYSEMNTNSKTGGWVSYNGKPVHSICFFKDVSVSYGLYVNSGDDTVLFSSSDEVIDIDETYESKLKTFNIDGLWPIGIKSNFKIMLKIYGTSQTLTIKSGTGKDVDYVFETKDQGVREYMSMTKSFIGYDEDTNIELTSESSELLEIIGISVRGVINEP